MIVASVYYDSRTGEVVPDEVVQAVARDFRAASDEYAAGLDALAKVREAVERYREDLVAIVPAEGSVDVGDAYVVMQPPSRPAQRVSRSGCERHAERLLGMGLGSMAYAPPGIAEVRRRSAELIAAGIPLAEIAPEPMAGPPAPVIVAKAGGA